MNNLKPINSQETDHMPELSNNKRIAKNTLLLYFRMFIVTIVGLYTSRVVLNTLGISDYGIYNLVGGIVTMLSFLNSAMTAASQRFISYELGRGELPRLKVVFSTSVNIHILIAFIVLVIAETVGLWFINTKLNIDTDRMVAANWVYQCSIITFVVNILSVPYNSCIVAHEKMSAFAYIGILDVVLKLIVVFLLRLAPFDKLIVYAVLILLVSVLIRFCYSLYCKRHFEECFYLFTLDKKLFKEMFSFAGWSVVGNMGFSLKDQVSNIILNLFYGTTLNASRGIGIQVSNVIKTFSNNLSMALKPQITKQYAAGNVEESIKLVYAGSRYTFFLLTLISIPVIINVDYILKLWLGIVPEYTSQFLILSLLIALLYSISGCVTTAIQATGKIKIFQIGICVLMLSELPLDYLLLWLDFPPYFVMLPSLVTYSLAILFRFYLIKHMIPSYSYKFYFLKVLIPCILIFVLSLWVCIYIKNLFQTNLWSLICTTIISIIIIAVIVFYFGMSKPERKFIVCVIRKSLKRNESTKRSK